jgi:hypothetical protein
MKITKWLVFPICVLLTISTVGCADYGQYAQAKKEEAIAAQLLASREEAKEALEQREHEAKMITLTNNLMTAVAGTTDKTDDVLAPLMVMMLEDKWSQTKTMSTLLKPKPQVSEIKAPESAGEFLQKATNLVLGAGGIYLGVRQSDNMKDVATAGINGAGTHTTATNGSFINTGKTGDGSVNSGSSAPVTTTNTTATTSSYNTAN